MSEIDRILADEADIEPSSGFALGVMRAVATEQPVPPLPFPWGRFTAGVAACAGLAVIGSLPASAPDLAAWRTITESLSLATVPLGYAAVTICMVYCGLRLHSALVSEA